MHEARTLTPEGLARSREWYERAIALDSGFALVHSMYAFHFAQLANYGLLPAQEAIEAAVEQCVLAFREDPLDLLGACDWHNASGPPGAAMTQPAS